MNDGRDRAVTIAKGATILWIIQSGEELHRFPEQTYFARISHDSS